MQLTSWEREHGSACVDDYGFFERPLTQPVGFIFKTRCMAVSPHGGAYSLKFTLTGREVYTFGTRRLPLLPGEMLLVERGRIYGSEIAEPTQSLSLFVPDDWVGEAAGIVRRHPHDLLGEPGSSTPPGIPAVPLRLSSHGRGHLARLVDCLTNDDGAAAVELSLTLFAEALGLSVSTTRLRARLKDMRLCTRDELLTRLRRAHYQIVDSHGLGIDLCQLSQTACLSRFHFLRLFKLVYGQTPLRLAASVRMQRAMRLVAGGEMDAALIAGGFGSRMALNRALRRTANADESAARRLAATAGYGPITSPH